MTRTFPTAQPVFLRIRPPDVDPETLTHGVQYQMRSTTNLSCSRSDGLVVTLPQRTIWSPLFPCCFVFFVFRMLPDTERLLFVKNSPVLE